MKKIVVNSENSNQRLDKFLLKFFNANAATKGFIYKMLRKKNIKLNNLKSIGNEILKSNDEIFLYLSDQTINKFHVEPKLVKSNKPVDVLYQDQDLIICNKPAGVLSHPNNGAYNSDSLLSRLYNLYDRKIFLCNRLDRNTSGLIVCAKNFLAAQTINKIIFDKKMDKYYLAIVRGKIDTPGRLEDFIIKNKDRNQVEIIKPTKSTSAKKIITEYWPLKSTTDFSLVKIKLVTGKSHQIRVHFKNINHPLIGDTKYGSNNVNLFFKQKFNLCHQLLHAYQVSFFYREVKLDLKASPPQIFLDIIKFLF